MAGVCEGECMWCSLKRCHSCGLPHLYEAFGWKSFGGRAYNLKDLKVKISFFSLALFLFYSSSFLGMMRADPAVAGEG